VILSPSNNTNPKEMATICLEVVYIIFVKGGVDVNMRKRIALVAILLGIIALVSFNIPQTHAEESINTPNVTASQKGVSKLNNF